ncbi:class I SAM-dependent methyltransferase [Sinorhizobium sp. CCBAU 05631]|uniref:methyltransferase domain-containing protein n=1 Tax=Sinorhizobium sp. CCBAU 05631 TaxID=794846 RepID=UPI0004B0D46B|nr:class I SAM-dependent methyltransferase [Sinorhizobium sp. CCBAU 05631]ASY57915.1 methyltransferase type 12 [Sinorhizobium sp. CCBAU 05631]
MRDRIGWAVEMLAPEASECILEIGCGHGLAATMVCDRLVDGRLLAIDRSAAMIEAARRRNAAFVADGRAEFVVAELARAEFGSAVFDKAFALRVGIFARGNPERELAVLARYLSPFGRLFLFHDEPSRTANDLVPRLEAGVCRSGWMVEARATHRVRGCDVACVVARHPDFAA